jgi:hypothetical protein
LVLVLVSVQGCDFGACRSDAIDNEDDFVRWVTSDEWRVMNEWVSERVSETVSDQASGVMSMLYFVLTVTYMHDTQQRVHHEYHDFVLIVYM